MLPGMLRQQYSLLIVSSPILSGVHSNTTQSHSHSPELPKRGHENGTSPLSHIAAVGSVVCCAVLCCGAVEQVSVLEARQNVQTINGEC